MSDAEVDVVLTEIAANGALVEPASLARNRKRRSDEHLWELVGAIPRAILVTGDQKLIQTPARGARVITARAFIDLLEE